MKILLLTSRFPYPTEKGDKLRVFQQMRQLSKRHQLVLCALCERPPRQADIEAVQPYCSKIYTFRLSKAGLLWQLGQALLGGRPVQVRYFYRRSIHRQLLRIVEQEAPDHLFCQLIRMAPYRAGMRPPASLDYMDAFSWGMQRRAANSPFWQAFFFRREARLLRQYEAEVFAHFNHHCIISQQDREQLAVPQRQAIHLVPNGVDTHYFHPMPEAARTYELVFVGNMGYFPNVQAARVLVKEVLPLLQAARPGLRLLLAGARPAPAVRALARAPGVSVSGWLPDIRTAYSSGRIFVAPLMSGSGQQNKILEAMAMGLPCITTPGVNQAIGAQPETEILLAADAAAFARQVLRLLQDEGLQTRLATNGRRFVQTHYSWERAVQLLEAIWKE